MIWNNLVWVDWTQQMLIHTAESIPKDGYLVLSLFDKTLQQQQQEELLNTHRSDWTNWNMFSAFYEPYLAIFSGYLARLWQISEISVTQKWTSWQDRPMRMQYQLSLTNQRPVLSMILTRPCNSLWHRGSPRVICHWRG